MSTPPAWKRSATTACTNRLTHSQTTAHNRSEDNG